MSKLIVYTPKLTARIEYTFKFVLQKLLGLDYELTISKEVFLRSESPALCYSPYPIDKGMWVQSHPLLTEKGIHELDIKSGYWKDMPLLFKTGPGPDLPFDLFAGTFYLLSRYEEYLDFKADHLGRFPASESVAIKNGFLDIPVINLWAKRLKNILKIRYPELLMTPTKFKSISTIDVDQAWAYMNKGWIRNFGGAFKFLFKGNLKELIRRGETLLRMKKDPFETYSYLNEIFQKHSIRPVFFYQVGRYGKYDKNISGHNPAMKSLIREVNKFADVGIHPSFSSGTKKEFREEIQLMRGILKGKLEKSRQHFIQLHFPLTYRNLMKYGIREDYSMGFSEVPGFRAGTATPFQFYDLGKEKETDMIVYPFVVMDSCLNYNLNLSPDQSIEIIRYYIHQVRAVGGTFISIWHNSSLSDEFEWRGWKMVFEEMIRMIK